MAKNLTKDYTRATREDCFYVYRHLRNDTGKPMYIGRGKHVPDGKSDKTFYARAYSQEGRTKRWRRIVNKHGYTIEILVDNLTLGEANRTEREFIKLYGKIKSGGILVNYKNGGEDGATDYKHSKETIEKFTKSKRRPLEYYLDNCVEYEPMSGCWIWAGQFKDFPKVNSNGRTLQAARAIYQHLNGVTLKPKSEVLHNTCGMVHCVNPQHYRVDCACPKEKQTRKLTEQEVIEIVELLKTTEQSNRQIAKKYNVKTSSIEAIITGRTWKWVTGGGVERKAAPKNKRKEVKCVDTGKVFAGSKEASTEMFGHLRGARTIRQVCTGDRPLYLGYSFCYV